MKQLQQVIIGLLFLTPFISQANDGKMLSNELTTQNKTQATFEENLGQVCDQNRQSRPDVLYFGQSGELVYHIRKDGISYNLSKVTLGDDNRNNSFPNLLKLELGKGFTKENYRVDLNWKGSNQNFEVINGKALAGYTNYYNVAEGLSPALFVKNYQSVLLKNLWEGVDLHYYSTNGVLESDWLMKKSGRL